MNWRDLGSGLRALTHDRSHEVPLTPISLDAVSVPVAVVDPGEKRLVSLNRAAAGLTTAEAMQAWLSECKELASELAAARSAARSVDLSVPIHMCPPFQRRGLTMSWTLHCHCVQVDGRRLMTIQAPSAIEPDGLGPSVTGLDTATDCVVRLIDRALDAVGGKDALLVEIRSRVLEGRMSEPLCFDPSEVTWSTGASLAVMLGLCSQKSVRDLNGTV